MFVQLDCSCTRSIALSHNQLEDLNLSSTDIDEAALSHFTNSPWPKLQLNPFANSTWLNLRPLELYNNEFDNTAMAFLAKGNWQNLEVLSLYGNEICARGIELLMAGQWPKMRTLTLDCNSITAAPWALLDSLLDPMPDCRRRRKKGVLFYCHQQGIVKNCCSTWSCLATA